jgi:hypothetical protein
MDNPDFKPGKAQKAVAAAAAILAIGVACLDGKLSSRLNMCALLLLSWNLAFIPGPPLRTPLREVHQMARRGWRTPLSGKLVTALAIVLLGAGTYFMFKGR